MENRILLDPLVHPDNILESALGKKYALFENFRQKIAEQNLILEWHYYLDAKSWLGKVLYKKKNLCWLSVWNTGFKLTFYFPEKIIDRVYALDIDDEIIMAAKEIKSVGKSRPVMLLIRNKKIMNNAFKILDFKRNLK